MKPTYTGYNNLIEAMKLRRVTFEDLAYSLKCSCCRLRARILCGKGISIIEAILIQEEFFPDLSLGYLFSTEGSEYDD